jgi:taurine dioxygenase
MKCEEASQMGAIISEIDVKNVSTSDIAALKNAIYKYKVVSIKGQCLTIDSFEKFVKKLGSLISHRLTTPIDLEHPYADIVHRTEESQGVLFGGTWHSDGSFETNPPDFTCVWGERIPTIKNMTSFGDCVSAYNNLSSSTKDELSTQKAIHTPKQLSQTRFDGMTPSEHYVDDMNIETIHPVVMEHPHSKEKYLYVNFLYTSRFEGKSERESEMLLMNLFKQQVKTIYNAVWEPGMILIWDNRLVVHKAVRCQGQERKIVRYLVRDEYVS